jgi:hydrogenase maturation protease
MTVMRILLLGVGNILLRDEGVGVKTVLELDKEYDFSPNVQLLDGGTLGLRLLDPICEADHVIVVDAVRNGQPPGTLYRLDADDLHKSLTFKNSLHQFDLMETLAFAEVLGKRPSAVVVGIEPEDISPWGLELTDTIRPWMPELCSRVLEEVTKAGGWYRPRSTASESDLMEGRL